MSSIEAELRDEIARDQRLAHLSVPGIASDSALRRRRLQIGFVAAIVTGGLLTATFAAERVVGIESWIDTNVARIALVGFTAWIAFYCLDQDRHLKRVETQRARLFQLDGEIAFNLLSAGLVFDAVTALHATLELDQLLPVIVEQGRSLVGGDHGVLFLYEDRGPMQAVVDPEHLAAKGDSIAELVMARNAVVGIVEDGTVNIGVPIGNPTAVLAVLVLPGVVGGEPNEDTLEMLSRFGLAAGSALENARRYEAAMFLLDVAH